MCGRIEGGVSSITHNNCCLLVVNTLVLYKESTAERYSSFGPFVVTALCHGDCSNCSKKCDTCPGFGPCVDFSDLSDIFTVYYSLIITRI